jgi:hypothetical protein
MAPVRSSAKNNPSADLGFEAKLELPAANFFSFLISPFYFLFRFVLAKGSMSSNQSGEETIRQAFIEADHVDSMVALPGILFYSVQISACLRSSWARIRHPREWPSIVQEMRIPYARRAGG